MSDPVIVGLVIPDRGMQTPITDDSNSGVHSQEGYISNTLDGELSTNVLDVCNWLEEQI